MPATTVYPSYDWSKEDQLPGVLTLHKDNVSGNATVCAQLVSKFMCGCRDGYEPLDNQSLALRPELSAIPKCSCKII